MLPEAAAKVKGLLIYELFEFRLRGVGMPILRKTITTDGTDNTDELFL